MSDLTLAAIFVLDDVIPDLRKLQMAVTLRGLEYGKASETASNAWKAFGAAVDDGKPASEINRLGDIAEEADRLLHNAAVEWNQAKADLLRAWS